MGTWTAAISVAAVASVVSPAGSRRRRGPATVRCSSSASAERQALFNRIAPVYDHVRTFRLPLASPSLPRQISAGYCNVILTNARRRSFLAAERRAQPGAAPDVEVHLRLLVEVPR
jgi:hypothetical protein